MNTENMYFAFVEMKYAAKNSFQEQILKRVDEFNRLLVESPGDFLNSLYFTVNILHLGYRSCTALTIK